MIADWVPLQRDFYVLETYAILILDSDVGDKALLIYDDIEIDDAQASSMIKVA